MQRLCVFVRWVSFASLFGLWAPQLSHAQDTYGYYEEPPPETRVFSITMSPLLLLLPLVQLHAEIRLGDHLGLAAVGSYGQIAVNNVDKEERHFRAWQAGGQAIFYPSQAFRALQFGIETMYMNVAIADSIGSDRVSGVGAGIASGPFIGYKWIAEVGFTVFLQGGFEVALVKTRAKNDLGQNATTAESDIRMLLNINLGWSF